MDGYPDQLEKRGRGGVQKFFQFGLTISGGGGGGKGHNKPFQL